jgi:hypothetical protein
MQKRNNSITYYHQLDQPLEQMDVEQIHRWLRREWRTKLNVIFVRTTFISMFCENNSIYIYVWIPFIKGIIRIALFLCFPTRRKKIGYYWIVYRSMIFQHNFTYKPPRLQVMHRNFVMCDSHLVRLFIHRQYFALTVV